jgi:hypothetical protein
MARANDDDVKLTKAKPRRSILASGLLSFFFGPLGWLYAAPWKVAVPAAAVYVLLVTILPQFMMVYIVGLVAPISAIGGVLYAIGFNMAGKRTPIFGKEAAEVKKLVSRA